MNEVSFHCTFSHLNNDDNEISDRLTPNSLYSTLKTELENVDPLTKYNFARILMHHVSYTKPDLEYHVNTNSHEIEYYLSENDFDLFKNIQSKMKTHDIEPEIKIAKVHKIIHPYSKLLGPPYPEKVFVRHKVNIHIRKYPVRYPNPKIDNGHGHGPINRSTPSRQSF